MIFSFADDEFAYFEPGNMELYLTRHKLKWMLLILACAAAGAAFPAVAGADTADQPKTQSYFVQQAVDEDLLITINAFEAEFESKVSGAGGELLLASGITGSRIVPVFQYIYAPKANRQIDIEVTSRAYTGRTEFGIELTRLKPWDSRSSSVSQAYRLLSFGTELDDASSQAGWTVKIDSLTSAGQLFEQYGMQEMRLWANYMAAHHVLFQLHDYSITYSMTRDILSELKGTRLQKIELATLQLQGMALIGLRKSGVLKVSEGDADPVQTVLSRAAELAASMDYKYEQARALYASGREYFGQSSHSAALERFQLAVQIADALGSAEMAKEIRESIVQVHTILGDAPATSEVLQEIESQLVESGGGDELALNLLAQARLMIGEYRYREALEVLAGALGYQNNSAISSQINFELARILHETGRFFESLTYLQLAGINPDSGRKRLGNLVIDAGEGLRIMANIYRYRGEFERMRSARTAQGQYPTDPGQYLYDQGMDLVASVPADRQPAAALLRRSFSAAGSAGHADLEHLSRMQYCVLTGPSGDLCSKAALDSAYEWLYAAGLPRRAAEAMYLRAQMLARDGLRGEALELMNRLADDMHMLRFSLPGVLGAWYWERSGQVFDTWLGMLAGVAGQRGPGDASASLLALSKMRMIEGIPESVAGDSSAGSLLRTPLAQRVGQGPAGPGMTLKNQINSGLDGLRADFKTQFGFLSDAGLKNYLRSLEADETVLTWHIGPRIAQVWSAGREGVQQRAIANPSQLYKSLQTLRQELPNLGLTAFDRKMDELGRQLLQPVAATLTETIYTIPSGALLGVPLDALRLEGRYLIERKQVVNLLAFPHSPGPGRQLQVGAVQNVFLAGNPLDYAGDYATRLETSAEISTVADLFVGPGLQIVQGVALLPDEFEGGFYNRSDLVHLAMPGVIDLKYPDESGLELSESEYEPGRVVLMSPEIRSQALSARLVFLSATRIAGGPFSDFSAQPGLVSDLMEAGAGAVIVNLWGGDSDAHTRLIADFYRELKATGSSSDSLRKARLNALQNRREDGIYDWAGYQLYTR